MKLTRRQLRKLIITEANIVLEDNGPTAENYRKSIDVYEKLTPALYEIDGFMKDTGLDSEDGFYNIGQMILGITALLLDDPKGAESNDYLRELTSLMRKLPRAHKNLR